MSVVKNILEMKIQMLKMNKIINKFLLARDRFMPKLHLKQAGFT